MDAFDIYKLNRKRKVEMNKKELYLVAVYFIPKTNVPDASVSDIFKNETEAWSYVEQQVNELSKKDKIPVIVINQFRKKVVVSIGNHGSGLPHPTPSVFIFSIHKTHFQLEYNKNCEKTMENKIEKAKKPFISEDNKDIIDSWYKRADEVTPETFGELINELLHGYDLDYGAKIHAAAACTIAMFNACNDIFRFSGFQASASIMQILYKLNYSFNETGIRVLDYDNMLYPQYEDRFRSISLDTWKRLRKKADELIDENKSTAAQSVLNHWTAISRGIIPFGYYISD